MENQSQAAERKFDFNKYKRLSLHPMYDIIGVVWRSGITTIGVIAIKTTMGWKAYIGCGGVMSDEMDAHMIAAQGAKLKKREAIAFFPEFDRDKCENKD